LTSNVIRLLLVPISISNLRMSKQMKRIPLLILLFIRYSNSILTLNKIDYDAYGLKIGMNEVLLVQHHYNVLLIIQILILIMFIMLLWEKRQI
jgi:hypothetical protein